MPQIIAFIPSAADLIMSLVLRGLATDPNGKW